MKYIKSYESIENNKPKVGDYVLMKTKVDELKSFIDNTIGILYSIDHENESDLTEYTVKYENVPPQMNWRFFSSNESDEMNCKSFRKELLVEFAPTIEELKIKLTANKFNL